LFLEREAIERITLEIRKYRPRLVFAPYWQDRHPDHVMCSRLVEEAVFNAKLRNFRPDVEPVTVQQLYFYFINDVYEPQVATDVSEVYEAKRQALRAYASQFTQTGRDIVATPLNQGYLERVEARDYLLGQRFFIRYAEGFASKLPQRIELF
jgi:bacillithiol biosynthesis deacetylase BshB1